MNNSPTSAPKRPSGMFGFTIVWLGQIISVLASSMTGKIIDVTDDEDGEHVEIFVE